MTISSTTSKATYNGNGTTHAFAVPFYFLADADLIVTLVSSAGVETVQTITTHYTVTGAGVPAGGTVTMITAPATGETLVIKRSPGQTQETDYVENEAFPAEAHERALDLLTMICQSLQEQIDRAVLYPVSTSAEDILDSTDFLDATTANVTAAQAAQTAAETAQGLAETARGQAQGYAASASGSAASAAASAEAAAEIVSTGLPTASTSIKGVVQLATSAEVSTGTDAAKAVTPAALKPALEAKLNVSGALAAIGAAASGANADITSLSGLTTPLSVAQGGTGASTAAAARTALGVTDYSSISMMYALLYCRSASRASGPIPNGYLFPLITDELVTKTNATFDGTGKYYGNAGGAVTVAASESSSTGSIGFYTDVDDLFDGDSVSCLYSAASGATILLQFASAKALNKWTVNHETSGAYSITWTGAGAHVYWRLRWTADMANSGSASVSWVIEYSDNGSSWTAASTTKSYTANSVVISMAVEAQGGDMTLVPAAVTTAAHPSSVTVRFLHKAVDSVTYGTDLKLRVSTDNGSNWTNYGTITKLCAYDATFDLLEATFDTSGLTGTSLKPEITTHNTKSQQVAGIALGYAA